MSLSINGLRAGVDIDKVGNFFLPLEGAERGDVDLSAELDPAVLDSMVTMFGRVDATVELPRNPRIMLTAFDHVLEGILVRLDGIPLHLGTDAERLELAGRAPRTLWLRIKHAYKRINTVHRTLDLLLKNPLYLLRFVDAEKLHTAVSHVDSLHEGEFGMLLSDLSSRAHDVRNLLGSLATFFGMLAEELKKQQALPVDQRTIPIQKLNAVSRMCPSGIDRVRAILTREKSADLSLEDAVSTLRLHCGSLGLELGAEFNKTHMFSTGKELPLLGEDLYRILFNTVDNARKHGAAKKIQVICKKEEGCLFITIRDDGTGLMREPFDVKAEDGHGFGVASCRALCESVGGTLTHGPLGGPGAEWTLMLPLKEESGAQPEGGQ